MLDKVILHADTVAYLFGNLLDKTVDIILVGIKHAFITINIQLGKVGDIFVDSRCTDIGYIQHCIVLGLGIKGLPHTRDNDTNLGKVLSPQAHSPHPEGILVR